MDELLNIMRILRSKNGCKWDRKQTLETLKDCLLEETHEALDAITDSDYTKLEEELGDLLCVVFMLIIIAGEKGYFSKESVFRRAIDTRDQDVGAAVEQRARQGPGAAANIENVLTVLHIREPNEHRSQQSAPAPHQQVIVVTTPHRSVIHSKIPPTLSSE